MKKLIVFAIFVFVGWQGYARYHGQISALIDSRENSQVSEPARSPGTGIGRGTSNSFKCDGRIYCSQMTSCEEATFFLRNCPGVKMDGNNDGVPCEKQWCK
ncbi:MAG: excalibur calcium-binding domain-containing protein [Rhodocyclales bacterium]|nr:excalibur calcium-binding domain-containing protein [Rhodocyclales bacterium]